MDELRTFLKENFLLDENKEYSDEEILQLTVSLMSDFRTVLINSGIVLDHAIKVFQSMASRGAYPKELVPDSNVYCGREGYKEHMKVFEQILPVMHAEAEKRKLKEKEA